MTKREAKRLCCLWASALLDSDLSAVDPPEWVDDETEALYFAAMHELIDELLRRGSR